MTIRKGIQGTMFLSAVATLMLAPTAYGEHIHQVRGNAAVLRGHSRALSNYLHARNRTTPCLTPAHHGADRLAAQADALFELTRCTSNIPRLDAALCALERSHREVRRLVDHAVHSGHVRHLQPACHLLDEIDRWICRTRDAIARLSPPLCAPDRFRGHNVHLGRPTATVPHLVLRPNNGFHPHVGPHVAPHVAPHRGLGGPVSWNATPRNSVHLRIGGLRLSF